MEPSASARSKESALRLIGRVYLPRIMGLAFAFLTVSFFLFQYDAHPLAWALLILWALIWPHLAHQWPRFSAKPLKAEIINLYVDAFMMGFWVPFMHFNTVPSIAMLYMHMLSIMSVMGFRASVLCLLAELGGIGLGVLIYGLHLYVQSESIHFYISLPILVIYPLFVGYNAYWLSKKLSDKQRVLKRLSQIDGLTGIFNRVHWEEQVSREFARVLRGGPPASLVFIDVDHFKRINDRHGHLVGDVVLCCIAHVLQDSARDIDVVGRYGGEEFGVLMPNTRLGDARAAAERLREIVNGRSLHPDLNIRTTISLGVAEISSGDETYSQWLDRADQATYAAKQKGRNVTVCAGEPAALSPAPRSAG